MSRVIAKVRLEMTAGMDQDRAVALVGEIALDRRTGTLAEPERARAQEKENRCAIVNEACRGVATGRTTAAKGSIGKCKYMNRSCDMDVLAGRWWTSAEQTRQRQMPLGWRWWRRRRRRTRDGLTGARTSKQGRLDVGLLKKFSVEQGLGP